MTAATPNNRYVLLDRDGVINQDSDDFIKSADEWLPLPGSLEAIALFHQHGYRVVVITNQSGVGRGLYDDTTLQQIHDKMQQQITQQGGALDAIYYCPHTPEADCLCRKPRPGLLLQCAAEKQLDLRQIYMVGDTWRDLQAAKTAGARPILVKTGKGQKTLHQHPHLDVPVFDNLYEAAPFIISG